MDVIDTMSRRVATLAVRCVLSRLASDGKLLRQSGKDGRVSLGQQVVLVDGPHEIQEVLEAVLAPRGLRVDWLPSHLERLPGENSAAPDLVVIDATAVPIHRPSQRRSWRGVPQILLCDEPGLDTSATESQHAVFNKPFQFPELIQAIEQLLPH